MPFADEIERATKAMLAQNSQAVITVTDAEYRNAALKMIAEGFIFEKSPRSDNALRAYLEGKQLMLVGTSGIGKTFFFESLMRARIPRHPLKIYTISEHNEEFLSEVMEDIRDYSGFELVLNDVGTENEMNGSRDRDRMILEILEHRLATREGLRTHITTNMKKAEVESSFGDRVRSRLQMFEKIIMTGNDNRKPETNRDELAYRAACANEDLWKLCKDRCPHFVGGICKQGHREPPLMHGRTPEEICGVGKEIPYRDDYLQSREEFRNWRKAEMMRLGLPLPDYMQ